VIAGSLCTGYGGLDQGVGAQLDIELAWVADNDPDAAKALAQRYPGVQNLGDITVVDWYHVTPIEVLLAGFPCQDVSVAGARDGLLPGNRSGVWSYCALAISVLRPPLVIIENVKGLLSARAHSDVEPCPWCVGDSADRILRALGAVLGDLASLGYDAEWETVSAADAGCCHQRERVFIVAWPAADPQSDGRDEGWSESAGVFGGSDGAKCGFTLGTVPDADRAVGSERREPAPV
jgi:DNA (cytosine-5)-methyltransferase 1